MSILKWVIVYGTILDIAIKESKPKQETKYIDLFFSLFISGFLVVIMWPIELYIDGIKFFKFPDKKVIEGRKQQSNNKL